LIALLQALALYYFDYIPSPPAGLDGLAPYALFLAQGLPSTTTSNLPTAILFFISSSYLASVDRVGLAKCLTLFCYLLGSTWGALLLGRQMVGEQD
jgi:hypothetical protein